VIGFITNEFHEFWCLFICRRAFVEIHIKGPKMCKRTKHTTILRQAKEPKGEKAHYGTKLGPRREEEKPITQAKSHQLHAKPFWAKSQASLEITH
jgi:hypothetical protein